jgi:DNA-binding MarR family transcriptional regulator
VRLRSSGGTISIRIVFISLFLITLLFLGQIYLNFDLKENPTKKNQNSDDMNGSSTNSMSFFIPQSNIALAPSVSQSNIEIGGSSHKTYLISLKIQINNRSTLKKSSEEQCYEFPLLHVPLVEEQEDIMFICFIYFPIGFILLLVCVVLYMNHTNGKNNNLLENNIRKRIYEYIKENPGIHYRAILNDLELPMGVLTYHLERLSKDEYITSAPDGKYRRYYIKGSENNFQNHISDIQGSILKIIRENQGISQSQIADKLKVSRKVINYHINILIQAKLISIEKNGRASACYANHLK